MENMCPCGSDKNYINCCQRIHNDQSLAILPVDLMRARYSAFVQKKIHFLVNSLDPQIREPQDEHNYSIWANKAVFNKLIIISDSVEKNKGTVEFKAYFNEDGKDQILHEISQFRKQSGQWYYRNGKVRTYEDSSRSHSS